MSTIAATMLDSRHANTTTPPTAQTLACIEACWAAAQACVVCADACLRDDAVGELRDCIRIDLNCAEICRHTAAVLSRDDSANPATTRAVLEACALICRRGGRECDRHADDHQHCRVCAEACHRCAQACRELLATLR